MKINQNKLIKIFLVVVLGVSFFVSSIFAYKFFIKKKNQVNDEEMNFGNYKKIAKVRNEYLFEDDLKNYFSVEGKDYFSAKKTEKDEAIQKIVKTSLVLQEGNDQKIINLSKKTFNNPEKDYTERARLFFNVKDYFEKSKFTNAEIISAVFAPYSQTEFEKKNSLEKSKQIVYSKMSNLLEKLKNNEISMKEAGDQLKSDNEIAEINPPFYSKKSYQEIAYSFKDLQEMISIVKYEEGSSEILQFLEKKEPGISNILLGRSSIRRNEKVFVSESFFSIVKISNPINEGFKTFSDWQDFLYVKYKNEIQVY